jgi:hypothetical protein
MPCCPLRSHPEVVLADDVVAVEHASRDVAGDRNRDSLTNTGAHLRQYPRPLRLASMRAPVRVHPTLSSALWAGSSGAFSDGPSRWWWFLVGLVVLIWLIKRISEAV